MAEIPLLIINVQRGGPSTGLADQRRAERSAPGDLRQPRRQPARRARRPHGGRLLLHRDRSGAHRAQIQHAGFHPQRHVARHPDRGLRRAEPLRAHARLEAGPDPGREPQALRSRPDHASRAARDADSRRQIPARQRPRARRVGPSHRQPEAAHGHDRQAPQQTAPARRGNSRSRKFTATPRATLCSSAGAPPTARSTKP